MKRPIRPRLVLPLAAMTLLQAGCANAGWLVPPHRIVAYHHKPPAAKKPGAGPAGSALSEREKDELFRNFVNWEQERQEPE